MQRNSNGCCWLLVIKKCSLSLHTRKNRRRTEAHTRSARLISINGLAIWCVIDCVWIAMVAQGDVAEKQLSLGKWATVQHIFFHPMSQRLKPPLQPISPIPYPTGNPNRPHNINNSMWSRITRHLLKILLVIKSNWKISKQQIHKCHCARPGREGGRSQREL